MASLPEKNSTIYWYITVNLGNVETANVNAEDLLKYLKKGYTILSAVGDGHAVHYILQGQENDSTP